MITTSPQYENETEHDAPADEGLQQASQSFDVLSIGDRGHQSR
jgi:hypothetical protein